MIGILILAGFAISSGIVSHDAAANKTGIESGSFSGMGWVLTVLGAVISVIGYLSEE